MMKKYLLLITMFLTALAVKAADEPTFPGGESALTKFIAENTRYPETAKENGIEGIVAVGFIVMTDGTLKNIKIIKFVDPDLETEALRVVGLMPAWEPAQKEGAPVEAPSKVEVPFILNE